MRLTLALAALAATVVTASPAFAAAAKATETAEARGVVLQSLTLTKVDDLDFGTVAGSALLSGTVSIDADSGARSFTGGVVGLPGTFQPAKFSGLGEADQIVQLTLGQPAAGVLSSGSNNIPALLALDAGGVTRTIGTTGEFTVYVGGDFDIAANQANGLYSAQFDLTADYQ
ncbi:MAG: DUF4402 domain-containing protein [Sphingomicrobium sp.]